MIRSMIVAPHADHRIEQRFSTRKFVERTLQTRLRHSMGHRQSSIFGIAANRTKSQIDVAARLNEALRGFGFS
jgi:hypothetical protein